MNNKITVLLLAVITIMGCKETTENTSNNLPPYDIDIRKAKLTQKSMSEFITDFSFIELKGVPLVDFVSTITKVEYFKDEIFVFDERKSNLLVFSLDGNFIRKIGKKGEGPGEYNMISDFVINKTTETITFIAENNIGLYEYELDGKFINNINFATFFPRKFALIEDAYYAIFTSNSNNDFHDIVYTDLNGVQKGNGFKYPQDIAPVGFAFTGGIKNSGAKGLYTPATSPIIYEIDKNLALMPKYNIDLGDNAWKEEDKFNLNEFSETIGSLEVAFLSNSYFENENLLVFNYMNRRLTPRGYYNFNTDELYTTESFKKDGLSRLIDNFVAVNDKGQFVVGFNPEYYPEMSKHFKGMNDAVKKLDEQLFDKLSKTTEDSNSYLLTFNFKF